MKLKILYIDDERVNLSNFDLVYGEKYDVATFLRAAEALAWLDENKDVAIVVSDQRMGAGTGVELLRKVSQLVPKAIRILVNSYVVTPDIEEAVKSRLITRCIQKPWNSDDFAATILMARDYFLLAKKNDDLLSKLTQTKDKLLAAEDVFEQRYRERVAEFSDDRMSLVDEIARCRRKIAEQEDLTAALRENLLQANVLSGMVPICASCKKVRDEQGVWDHVENYIEMNSDARFSHGICPDCVKQVYSGVPANDYVEPLCRVGKG